MADDRLRELERRTRACGTPADEAALLTERLRAGALSRDQLQLAATLGHAGAGLVLGGAPPDAAWLEGLEGWEPPVGVRVTVALLEARCSRSAPIVAVVAAAREWLARPEPALAERVVSLADRVMPSPGAFNPTGTRDDDDVAADWSRWRQAHPLEAAAGGLADALKPRGEAGLQAAYVARQLFTDLAEARAVAREAVLPWALDPASRSACARRTFHLYPPVPAPDAPSPAAAALRERLEAGHPRERLELAAFLGDPGAVELLRPPPPPPPDAPGEYALRSSPGQEAAMRAAFALAGEVRRLAPLGAEAVTRVHVALARATFASYDRPGWLAAVGRALGVRDQPPRPAAHLEVADAVEDWVVCPCPAHVEAATAARERAKVSDMSLVGRLGSAPLWSRGRWGDDRPPAAYLTDRLNGVASDAVYELWRRVGPTADRALRDALAADVLPWALGTGDPLRARVEARAARGGAQGQRA